METRLSASAAAEALRPASTCRKRRVRPIVSSLLLLALCATSPGADESEEAFRSSVRAALLAEARALPPAAVRTRIRLANGVGRAFALVRALVAIDGEPIWAREAAAIEPQRVDVFAGVVSERDHWLAAALTYRGEGYGIFTCLRGYRFRVSGRCSFTATLGPEPHVALLARERGSITAPNGDPPALHCRTTRGAW